MEVSPLKVAQTPHNSQATTSLNPKAPEFHPTLFTPNYFTYEDPAYHNPILYITDHPPVQLPHHHFDHHTQNYQQHYPTYSPYFTSTTDHHQYYQELTSTTTNNDNDDNNNTYTSSYFQAKCHGPTTMQPPQQQPQVQLVRPVEDARLRRTPARPNRVVGFRDHGAACRVGDVRRRSDSVRNYGRKEGFNGNGDWMRFRGCGVCGKWVKRLRPNGWETTAMIKNIPNQYTRAMLMEFLDEFCNKENNNFKRATHVHPSMAYDFLYLPIDFKSGANKGFAFVNFTNPSAVWKLHLASSGRGWEYCKSPKICQIAYATIQGKEKLIEHFGQSRFECNHQEYLPVCFSPPRDGSSILVKQNTIGELISPSSHIYN